MNKGGMETSRNSSFLHDAAGQAADRIWDTYERDTIKDSRHSLQTGNEEGREQSLGLWAA